MSDTSDPTEKTGAAGAMGKGKKTVGAKPGRAAGAKGARPGAKVGAGARKAAASKPAPVPVAGPAEGGIMKGKEFMTRVLARSGANRAIAKPVMDAVLAELGDSLARGEGFVLPPLGRAKIKPAKEGAKGDVIQVRLRRGGGKKDAETPLAPTED